MPSPLCLCIWNPGSQERHSRREAREKAGLRRYSSQCSYVNHKSYQPTYNNTGTQSNSDFMRQKIIQKINKAMTQNMTLALTQMQTIPVQPVAMTLITQFSHSALCLSCNTFSCTVWGGMWPSLRFKASLSYWIHFGSCGVKPTNQPHWDLMELWTSKQGHGNKLHPMSMRGFLDALEDIQLFFRLSSKLKFTIKSDFR